MKEIKEFMMSMGIGKNEAEVYAALAKIGSASVLDLSKETKLHRSNIYDALRKLLERGFVYEINEPTKLFSARPPASLIDYFKQKKAELTELVENYERRVHQKDNGPSTIRVTKGQFSIREALFALIKNKKPIFAYGIPKSAPEIIGPVLKAFHKDRIEMGIEMKHIYNSDALDRVQFLNKMKHTEARILPKKYDSFATTCISGHFIVIFLWDDDLTVIEITDENLAKPYQNYFDILWKKAVRPKDESTKKYF